MRVMVIVKATKTSETGKMPAKELVAGYWIWHVKSLDEAVEWVRRCPDPMPGEESEIEIRPFYEPEDFGAEYAPDFKEYEARLQKGLDHLRRFRTESEKLSAKK